MNLWTGANPKAARPGSFDWIVYMLLERRKYPDSPHWWHEAEPLCSDRFGDWFGVPVGTAFHLGDLVVESDVYSRVLVPHAGWWMARYLAGHPELDLYVDIVGPREFIGDRVVMVDYDLDVVRWCDGRSQRVQLLDEDEFEEHSVALSYPVEAVEQSKAAAAWVMDAVEKEVPPFDISTFALCGIS